MASEALKNKRKNAKASITRIKNFLELNSEKTLNVHEYTVREEALNLAYDRFCEAQDEIEVIENNVDDIQREELEVRFFEIKAELKRLSSEKNSQNLSSQKMSNNSSCQQFGKMPELVIEKFSGEQKNWASFFDIFQALVLNNHELEDVQKLIYLKSSLKGEPLKLIEMLTLTSTNLNIALNILKDRYQNKLATIYSHIKALVDVPSLSKNNPINLRDFIVNVKQNSESLKNLQVPVDSWDIILVYILSQKLDFNTRRSYELERGPTQLPTLQNFLDFLEKRCLATENLSSPDVKRRTINFATSSSGNHSDNRSIKMQNICVYCKNPDHNVYKCEKFKALSIPQRKQFIFNKHLCFKCFSNHSVNQCNWRNCPICDLPHNSLLHPKTHNSSHSQQSESSQNVTRSQGFRNDRQHSAKTSSDTNMKNESRSNTVSTSDTAVGDVLHVNSLSAMADISQQHILIATARVLVKNKNGKFIEARAVLDSGSQISLATSNFIKKLNLQSFSTNVQISGISGRKSKCNQMIDLEISSGATPCKSFRLCCSVMDRITCPLPQMTINCEKLDIPKTLILADPGFGKPGNIDLLLGSDIYYELIEPGLLKLGDGLPVLQNSCFGWVVGGTVPQSYVSFLNTVETVSLFTSTIQINNLMQKFWSLEEIPNNQIMSDEDELAEQIFRDTTKILGNGRFQINMPLKTSNEYNKLGESFHLAEKRFYSLERKLHRDKKMFEEYKKFIDEYVNLNHARYVPLELRNEKGENKYFIPHHCVIREDNITTRLRVVFDASMSSTSGYSLNDITLKGFQTQPDLFDILLRFRSFQFVLIGDIKKMFRQILINPSQTFLQNILWRETPTEDLKCIELLVLSYGVNFAPFTSTRCLLELANKYFSEFPLAAHAIQEQCYMDDILCGADNLHDLHDLRIQLIKLLGTAGFELHKWNSNSKAFFEQVNEPTKVSGYDITSDIHSSKVLGISWSPHDDYFSITMPHNIKIHPVTKRYVLSIISQIFDPLGFVSPIVVKAKMLMQKIWLKKLTWDQTLKDELQQDWVSFVKNLSDLSKQKIPRCIISKSTLIKIELHGFADASLKAYGACIYMRGLYENEQGSCHLVCSKSRISPLRTISLPRLELCACLLLANLTHKVVSIFQKIKIDSITLWSDSQISLCWIQSHPSRWNVFISNRVSRIQDLTSDCTWRHINSNENPADHLSRGLSSTELLTCTQWWTGPRFLFDFHSNSKSSENLTNLENIPEQRKMVLVVAKDNYWENVFQKYSCFVKLQRVIAFCLRFCNNSKVDSGKNIGSLKVAELENACNVIIRLTQRKHFSNEINLLSNSKAILNKALLSLSPFLDDLGILRVGGRLSNAEIPYSQKYPILLPSNEHIVALLLRREHVKLYHAGAQTVLSNFRLRFWPLNGLRQIKRIIHNCFTCYRFKAQAASQVMADLPKVRVTVTHPFHSTGLDFGGTFLLKTSRLRKAPVTKAYIAIFVCMVTKCVHMELVTSLSTEAFLLTLKRFIARRGNPSIIYSDNATNFLGARNQLKELYDFFKNKQNLASVNDFLSMNEIEWKFIPPKSPHWGGIWEAAIKSAKYHIYRVVGNTRLTYEEFSTVLAGIESILNSRPLTALSDDPSDLSSLTPGHFLIGRSLTAYPEKNVTTVLGNRLSIWDTCVKMQQGFWKRWSIEYLNRLQNKPKWLSPSKNLMKNQIVLLKEENNPPLKWALARIIEVIPGRDGKVRLVKVRTSDGTFTRSITRICPLPDNDTLTNIV